MLYIPLTLQVPQKHVCYQSYAHLGYTTLFNTDVIAGWQGSDTLAYPCINKNDSIDFVVDISVASDTVYENENI